MEFLSFSYLQSKASQPAEQSLIATAQLFSAVLKENVKVKRPYKNTDKRKCEDVIYPNRDGLTLHNCEIKPFHPGE